jgi:hypothetical protein
MHCTTHRINILSGCKSTWGDIHSICNGIPLTYSLRYCELLPRNMIITASCIINYANVHSQRILRIWTNYTRLDKSRVARLDSSPGLTASTRYTHTSTTMMHHHSRSRHTQSKNKKSMHLHASTSARDLMGGQGVSVEGFLAGVRPMDCSIAASRCASVQVMSSILLLDLPALASAS